MRFELALGIRVVLPSASGGLPWLLGQTVGFESCGHHLSEAGSCLHLNRTMLGYFVLPANCIIQAISNALSFKAP